MHQIFSWVRQNSPHRQARIVDLVFLLFELALNTNPRINSFFFYNTYLWHLISRTTLIHSYMLTVWCFLFINKYTCLLGTSLNTFAFSENEWYKLFSLVTNVIVVVVFDFFSVWLETGCRHWKQWVEQIFTELNSFEN